MPKKTCVATHHHHHIKPRVIIIIHRLLAARFVLDVRLGVKAEAFDDVDQARQRVERGHQGVGLDLDRRHRRLERHCHRLYARRRLCCFGGVVFWFFCVGIGAA